MAGKHAKRIIVTWGTAIVLTLSVPMLPISIGPDFPLWARSLGQIAGGVILAIIVWFKIRQTGAPIAEMWKPLLSIAALALALAAVDGFFAFRSIEVGRTIAQLASVANSTEMDIQIDRRVRARAMLDRLHAIDPHLTPRDFQAAVLEYVGAMDRGFSAILWNDDAAKRAAQSDAELAQRKIAALYQKYH